MHCLQQYNTIAHLIISCPLYNTERESLIRACELLKAPVELNTMLSEEFPAEELVLFLERVQYIDNI